MTQLTRRAWFVSVAALFGLKRLPKPVLAPASSLSLSLDEVNRVTLEACNGIEDNFFLSNPLLVKLHGLHGRHYYSGGTFGGENLSQPRDGWTGHETDNPLSQTIHNPLIYAEDGAN